MELLDGYNPALTGRLAKWEPVYNSERDEWLSGEVILDGADNELEIVLQVFRWALEPEQREWAFWKFAALAWHEDGGISAERAMEWNPWAEMQIAAYCRERFVAVGGAANGAKSHTFAAFAVASWMCDPAKTLVLITSTSITDSKKRVWKSVSTLLAPLIQAGLAPTNLRSNGSAPYKDAQGTIYDGAGLSIIAGAAGKEGESTRKLIGVKALPEVQELPDGRRVSRPRLLIGADELSELAPAIVESLGNLRSQQPLFVGLSNPSDKFTPFAEISEPEGGWDSVDLLNDDCWKTRVGGRYIRLDGLKSPNTELGRQSYPDLPSFEEAPVLFPYLPTEDSIGELKEAYGELSAKFLRFVRASFFSAAEANGCYNFPEFRQCGALEESDRTPDWLPGSTRLIAACDPAETDGGDNFPLKFATVGLLRDGRPAIDLAGPFIYLRSDDTDLSLPREFQIASQIKEQCTQRKLTPDRFAVDDTMGSWGAILVREWGSGVWQVNSNASATTRPLQGGKAEMGNSLTNKDHFVDRTAELWLAPKVLFRNMQVFNLPKRAAEQMAARGAQLGRSGTGNRVGLEPKKAYRKRTGGSPDEADTIFLLLDLAIERLGLFPEKEKAKEGPGDTIVFPVSRTRHPVSMSWFDIAGRNSEAFLL